MGNDDDAHDMSPANCGNGRVFTGKLSTFSEWVWYIGIGRMYLGPVQRIVNSLASMLLLWTHFLLLHITFSGVSTRSDIVRELMNGGGGGGNNPKTIDDHLTELGFTNYGSPLFDNKAWFDA